MCKVLSIHPSGYHAWLKQPDSKQEKRRKFLLGLIKQFWLVPGGVYGYRKKYSDLRDEGEVCSINPVHRLMKREGLQSQRGYRKPRPKLSFPSQFSSFSINIPSFSYLWPGRNKKALLNKNHHVYSSDFKMQDSERCH